MNPTAIKVPRTVIVLAFVSGLLAITVVAGHAQNETVIYNFAGGGLGPDGSLPMSGLISDLEGNLYGTTREGGIGYGTVFELSPNPDGTWSETLLYSFQSGTDGAEPFYSNLIFDKAGNLYGTAFYSGAHNYGVVFELSPTGKTWAEHVLYAFAGGSDGANPTSGLIFDTAGNLFGTTDFGGANGVGTVFELSPSGGAWTEHVIYNTVDSTGHGTTAGLVMDAAGNLFGTTSSSFFEVSPDGKGGWSAKVIHTFLGGAKDGNYAAGTPALDDVGNVYGTTFYGGKYNYGTVYELVRGKKKWTEKILLNFKGGSHGSDPLAGVVLDAARNVYGTTTGGGRSGFGTVFELVAPLTKGAYKEKVLWSFGNTDGNEPFGTLMMDSLGNIYGTTGYGGSSGNGVVFQVVP